MFVKQLVLFGLATVGTLASPGWRKYRGRLGGHGRHRESNDLETLNTLLRLEYFQLALFTEALGNSTLNSFTQAGYDEAVFRNIETIASHHSDYIDKLKEVVTAGGLTASVRDEYGFPPFNPKLFLEIASTITRVAVSSYLDIAKSLHEEDFREIVASIMAVQTRHATYLRTVLGRSPFTTAFETPLGLQQTLTGTSNFITGNVTGVLEFMNTDCPDLVDPSTTGIRFTTKALAGAAEAGGDLYILITQGLDQVTVPVTTNGTSVKLDTIPEGVKGSVYFGITTDKTGEDEDALIAEIAAIDIEDDSTLVASECINNGFQ